MEPYWLATKVESEGWNNTNSNYLQQRQKKNNYCVSLDSLVFTIFSPSLYMIIQLWSSFIKLRRTYSPNKIFGNLFKLFDMLLPLQFTNEYFKILFATNPNYYFFLVETIVMKVIYATIQVKVNFKIHFLLQPNINKIYLFDYLSKSVSIILANNYENNVSLIKTDLTPSA